MRLQAYIKKREPQFSYPGEMAKILAYLNEHGTIQVSEETVERLYFCFSDRVYCAGWMTVNDSILEEFSEWLSEIEV